MVLVKDPTLIPNSHSTSHQQDNPQIDAWLQRISEGRSLDEQQAIRQAYRFALELHQNTTRESTEPFIVHVLNVADILADLGLDTAVLIAAILHETVIQKLTGFHAIEQHFGSDVCRLVKGVTKMRFVDSLHGNIDTRRTQQYESLRRMLLAVVKDIRVMLLILADRLHDMRSLKNAPAMYQQQMAKETLDLFAPLANRLGIGQLKWELEDLSMRYLHPDVYRDMARLLDERRIDRESYIQNIVQLLSAELTAIDVHADVSGRPKHIYSIWRKMQRKNLNFEQIFDVRAVRVIVDNVKQCYETLGVVHSTWRPIPGEFDDYIASPKNNDYRSLHTAVFGPDDKVFEVQIRTRAMHHHAEFGVAAHWRYKEGNQSDPHFDQKIAWLRQIPQWKEESGDDANEFIDRVQSEIFEDRVYALTPKGQVIDLPQGATPLDFAYYIHTELGHRCRGALVNRQIRPLTYSLKNGDQVEILAARNERPSRDWLIAELGYLRTSRARSKVRQWLRRLDIKQHVQEGRQILERELRRLNLNDVNLEQLAQYFQYANPEQLFIAIGRGDVTALQIASRFHDQVFKDDQSYHSVVLPTETTTPTMPHSDTVSVHGVGGLVTEIANCCKPIPPDAIVGYISKGRGVVIHRRDCPNALQWVNEGSERLIEVSWGKASASRVYPVEIEVTAFERRGLLRDVSTLTTEADVNITAANTLSNRDDFTVKMRFTLEVNDLNQLSKLLSRIDHLNNVTQVARVA